MHALLIALKIERRSSCTGGILYVCIFCSYHQTINHRIVPHIIPLHHPLERVGKSRGILYGPVFGPHVFGRGRADVKSGWLPDRSCTGTLNFIRKKWWWERKVVKNGRSSVVLCNHYPLYSTVGKSGSGDMHCGINHSKLWYTREYFLLMNIIKWSTTQ